MNLVIKTRENKDRLSSKAACRMVTYKDIICLG